MGDRRKAREFALQVMFGIDLTKESAAEALRLFWTSHDVPSPEIRAFTEEIVKGTADHINEIDNEISAYSANWKISRMSVTDRNVLRLGVYELKFIRDIPARVTLNEAIEIAKQYGAADSGSFVNGILDKIAKSLNKE